jgi:hypothetical protein
MTDAKRAELINAAYSVVRYPSVGAYRSGGSDKKVARKEMVRLLKALEAIVEPDSQAALEITHRIAASHSYDVDLAAALHQMDVDRLARAERLEEKRHPFEPTGFVGSRCAHDGCSASKADAVHRDGEGEYL